VLVFSWISSRETQDTWKASCHDVLRALVPRLDLVVASNNVGVRWRNSFVIVGAALAGIRGAGVLLGLLGLRRVVLSRVAGSALGAVVHASVLSTRLLCLLMLLRVRLLVRLLVVGRLDIDVGDAAALIVLRQRLVLVGRLGVSRNDIPGVEKARNITEDRQEDVDERVGAADTALDPDWQRGKENGQQAKEDVCGTHGNVKSWDCLGKKKMPLCLVEKWRNRLRGLQEDKKVVGCSRE
jgi:hypothetical protein